MSLNIKNEEVHKMAAELAAIRGVSMTALMRDMLRKEMEAEKCKQSGKGKAARILEFAQRFRKGLPPGLHSSDHDSLYGEDGLPR
jgi:antitoxin VapB